MTRRIAINTRVLSKPMTGVQRYTSELLACWNGHADRINPTLPLQGIKGHAWEQIILPERLKSRLLFSPSNSGPLGVTNQVVTIHDMVYFDHPETLNRRFAAWFQFLLPRLARRVRKIITVSEFIKERVMSRAGVQADKIVVVANGVGPRFCVEAIALRDEAIARLGIPTTRYVLALGSIEPRKNVPRLLRSWERIQGDVSSDVWLVVAGGEGHSDIFRKESAGVLPPRVFLAGHVPDEILPGLCAGALAMAYPSIYEGFGLPVLEAMACGVPVIAGDCCALRELTRDAAILVDPLNDEAIREGLIEVVGDEHLREHLRKKGLERAKAFSWRETARKTWKVLQDVAEDV